MNSSTERSGEPEDQAGANVRADYPDQSEKRSGEQPPNVREQVPEIPSKRTELVEELRDHVAFLRGELEARNEEKRSADARRSPERRPGAKTLTSPRLPSASLS